MLSLSLIFVIILLLFTFFEAILPDHGRPDDLFSVTISPDAPQSGEPHHALEKSDEKAVLYWS